MKKRRNSTFQFQCRKKTFLQGCKNRKQYSTRVFLHHVENVITFFSKHRQNMYIRRQFLNYVFISVGVCPLAKTHFIIARCIMLGWDQMLSELRKKFLQHHFWPKNIGRSMIVST